MAGRAWTNRLRVGLLATLVAGGLLALPPAAAGTLEPSVPVAIVGEQVRFTGTLRTTQARPLALQRAAGTGWVTEVTGESDAAGRFSLSTTARPETTTYRVLAAPVAVGGVRLGATQTAVREVPVQAQSGRLSLTRVVERGGQATATATFKPARPGWNVALERKGEEGWLLVDSAVQDADGSVSWDIPTETAGTFAHRAVVEGTDGVPEFVTGSKAIKVYVKPVGAIASTRGTLEASVSAAIWGESITFAGTLPPAKPRPVELQRLTSGRWVTVAKGKTNAKGAFSFETKAQRSATEYRVRAEAAEIGHRHYAATQTPTSKVSAQSQSGRLQMPPSASRGERVKATVAFKPARPGRTVKLERQDGAAWVSVASAKQAKNGSVSFPVPTEATGSVTYRAVASPAKGAPAFATRPVEFTVTG